MSSETPKLDETARSGGIEFMLGLTSTLHKPGTNLVVSPFSLSSALTMVLAGAHGSSRAELHRTLYKRVPSSDDEHSKMLHQVADYLQYFIKENESVLKNANFLYGNQGFPIKPDYAQTLQKHFLATAKQLDFSNSQALTVVNGDVSQATNGLIKEFLQSIPPAVEVILVNAIYFKGLWKHQFDKAVTEVMPFKKSDGTVIQAPMMFKKKKFCYGFLEELDASAVRLEYQSGLISMLILLPNENSSVPSLLGKLNEDRLKKLHDNMSEFCDVLLTLPKFKLESTHNLIPTLGQLGISDIFGSKANLSGISEVPLFVSDVIQKAVIEVNEEGTEAAAATGIMMMRCCMPIMEEFKADRPFVFMLLTHDNSTVLFTGVVEDPTKQ